MTISRTQESQIHDLHLVGSSQRSISKEVNVCLDTVNKRINYYKRTGSIHKASKSNSPSYNPIEEAVRQRIRYYLSLERRKSKHTLDQIHGNLAKDGFEVSKSKTKEWVKLERNKLKESYLDIHYEPGTTVQFDWGSRKVYINGKSKVKHFAVFALPFSNYRYVHVTDRMDSKSFVNAFISFTKHVGCVFPVMVIDNMKIAVKHPSFKKNKVELTNLFERLEAHYSMEVRPCTPYKPNQKGTVENAVATLKQQLQGLNQSFKSTKHLQEEINQVFNKQNRNRHPEKNNICVNLMKHERAMANSVPSKHYKYFHEAEKKVMSNTLVSFEGNKYSAPEEYKGEKVTVQYNERTVRLVSKTGNVLAKYSRCYGKGYKKYRVWNMLSKLKRKSDGFDQSNEKRQMPKWLNQLYKNEFENEADEFFTFLELIQNVSKSKVKKMLQYHRAYEKKLTIYTAMDFISRC